MAELHVPQVDFSTLGNLGNDWRKGRAETLRAQTLAELGNGDGPLDYNAAARKLLAVGDREGAMSLATLGATNEQRLYQRGRDATTDARQATNDAFSHNLQTQSMELQRQAAARSADPTPAGFQRAADGSALAPIPGGPQDPAYIAKRAGATEPSFQQQIAQRRQAAIDNGIDPNTPGFTQYILTNKWPREDAQPLTATDKKAILEADEGVLSAKTGIEALKKASELSGKAFSGPMAGGRGYAASFLGDSSDLGKAGVATSELSNVVTSNALTQLKAIFGGAPTEGERKILLDIQGSVNQPHEVRTKIFDRARQMAENRLKFNEQRAGELRGGQFYKPQGAMTRAPVAQSQGITQEQYAALPSGAPFTAPDGSQRIKP